MKKAFFIVAMLFIVLMFSMACGNIADTNLNSLGSSGFVLTKGTGYDGVVYDPSSRTVFTIYTISDCYFQMPYIYDGHYCQFVDNHIVVNPCCNPNCRYSEGNTIVDPEEEP